MTANWVEIRVAPDEPVTVKCRYVEGRTEASVRIGDGWETILYFESLPAVRDFARHLIERCEAFQ